VAGTIAVRTAAAADTLCLDSPVACLFAKARIALGEVAVYPDSYTRDAARSAGKNDTAVCVAATRASFDFLLLAERACGTRAVWTVDGSVRPAAGDTPGAAGFAGCRHCGETFSSGAEYILLTSPLGHETRTCSSYDVETAAHTTVAHREREEKYMVLFDSSSPVDSAISFSDQHDRHRTDFFLDGILAAWTAKWKGKTVVMAHVKAHSGITVNEWADVEAKAALGAEIAIDIPEARPHASAVVKRPKTTAVFSAATIRVRTWACAAIQEAVIGWLRGSSTGTLRKGPGTVTPSLHDASRDAITLAQLAGDRFFASDLKHGQGASLRAARAEVCSCGSGPCDWWHYFVSCTAARAKREELFQQLHAAANVRPFDSAATYWLQAASTLRGANPRSEAVETALKRVIAVGVESTATSSDRRALVGAADKVAAAVLALVRHAKDMDEVLGARATVALKAATQLRGGFGHWASRTAAVGPGASALLRGARAEITVRAGSLLVANGAYPEPAILRAASALLSRNTTPAGRAMVLGYAMTSLRAALVLRAAWTAAREDAHDLSRLPGARAQTWLLVAAWRRMAVFGPVRPAQTAPAVSATITFIVEGVSGGSAAHIARHAAPAPAAPAPDASPAATGSSSSHAALPAPTAATTGFTATAPRAAGERATLRPSRGWARTNTLRRQADSSSPQCHHAPKDLSSERRGCHFPRRGDPRFPAFGRMGCGAASGDGGGGGRGTGTKAHARRRGQRSQGGYGAVETHWVGCRGATCQFGVR